MANIFFKYAGRSAAVMFALAIFITTLKTTLQDIISASLLKYLKQFLQMLVCFLSIIATGFPSESLMKLENIWLVAL